MTETRRINPARPEEGAHPLDRGSGGAIATGRREQVRHRADLLELLFATGRQAATRWLTATFDEIGAENIIDIRARIL